MTMTRKQIWALVLSAALIGLCFMGIANAQTSQKSIRIGWVLPTTFDDGSALLPANITKIQVFMANASIADTSTMAPTVELTGAPITTTRTFTAFAGGTIYARLKACTAEGCSPFSAQVSVATPLPKPGIPTSVTIELVLQ